MKKMIIVCEEKLRCYGDFLAQLISNTDDKNGKEVGIKDGVAAAQVWTEKEYTSNAAQLSSEQYLLFVGNSKLIKEKRHHMQKKYSNHGMNYGWLGKQAVLFVDYTLCFAEYESFYKLFKKKSSEGNQLEVIRLLPTKTEVEVKDIEMVEGEESTGEEKEDTRKLPAPFKAVSGAIKKTVDGGVGAFLKVSNNINATSKSKYIEDQQYTCLVLLFYLDGLAEFLGLNKA